jgi:putative phosphoribosyl transferase
VVPFVDRVDAGRRLGARLRHLRGADVVVLGLPRGGVPVASEVARALAAPLDVIIVRKLGVPSQPELAMGAVGEDGVLVVNERVVQAVPVGEVAFVGVERREREEVRRRAQQFRGHRARLPLAGRTALVVDDGIATGSTARAACRVARAHGAARVVLAAPVCAPDVARTLGDVADEMVCLMAPKRFLTVGQFYADFRPTSEAEVVELLRPGPGSYPVDTRDDPPPVAGTPR